VNKINEKEQKLSLLTVCGKIQNKYIILNIFTQIYHTGLLAFTLIFTTIK